MRNPLPLELEATRCSVLLHAEGFRLERAADSAAAP
jgi:hypothetical protein